VRSRSSVVSAGVRYKVLHVRVPTELVKALDHYAVEEEIGRPEALARLLRKGLDAVIAEGASSR
jgi:hypothetical protein